MHNLNLLVLFIAALSTYVVGGIWYSPGLFGKIWHRESRDPRPYTPSRPVRVLSVGILFSTIVVMAFANALGPNPTWSEGVRMGLYIGFGFVATAFGIHYQFTNHSLKLLWIDGAFRVVQFAVIGWILAGLSIAGVDSFASIPNVASRLPVLSEIGDANKVAILIAALSVILLGKLWYSPLMFGKLWTRVDAGRQQLRTGQPLRVFGVGFFFSVIAAAAFAFWLGPHPFLHEALKQGFLVGTCFVAASFVINYLCADFGWRKRLIDGGYHAMRFLVYGCVLGLFG